MNLYSITPPQKLRAGFIGEREFYFDCADCGASEPAIFGLIGEAVPTGHSDDFTVPYEKIGVICDSKGSRLALFCETCFNKRLNTELPETQRDSATGS